MLELRLAPESRPLKGQKFTAPAGATIRQTPGPFMFIGGIRIRAKTRASTAMKSIWMIVARWCWMPF